MKYSVKILLFLIALSTTPFLMMAQNNVIDEIVWVVGDEAILKSEVEEFRKEILMNSQRIEGDPYCFIPEQLAIRKLFLDQAKLDSIEVQESLVTRGVEYRINEMIASVGSVERVEEYWGKNIAGIREDLRGQYREQQLIETVQQKHFGDVKLTPSEIRKYFNSLPQDSLPFIPTTLELQIITAQPEIPLSEIDRVKAQLRDYTEQITSGKSSFSTLALLHSEDEGTALRGGEYGFSNKSGLVPEFANVAFALTDPAKVSNVVETEYGFHIIQLIERRGDMVNFRHILLRPKAPQESIDTAMVHLDSIRIKIIENKISFDDAATYLSADKNTRNNKGIMVNMRNSIYGGTPRFPLNELNQDIAKIAGEMKKGEMSQPFVMINDNGHRVAAIIKIKERNEGHKANINSDYQIIKQMAESAKQQELVDEWLQDKIRKTYVRIDPQWQGCEYKYKGWLK